MTAFWDKLKTQEKDQPNQDKATAAKDDKKPAKKATKASKKDDRQAKEKADLFSRVLAKPVVSENAMNQQALNKYVFQVSVNSNKKEVGKAIEAKYGVSVEDVNIVRYQPRSRYFRMMLGFEKGVKKAIVTVKAGDKIELFKEA